MAQAFVPVLPGPQSAHASTRPRYGGTLRVMMQARVESLDPREWPTNTQRASTIERLAALIYERLVRLDDKGEPQPELAISWEHTPNFKRWEFKLRPNVKFHDGSPLTLNIVAGRLQSLGEDAVTAVVGDVLRVESPKAQPDLLYELASWRNAIFKASAASGAENPAPLGLLGTGPFKLSEWLPRQSAVFVANDDHWGGRPFADKIEVEMGTNLREHAIALELGKTDVVDLGPAEFRRAAQAGRRTWASSPVEILALVFRPGRFAAENASIREALALSLDRTSIHTVLLQRQGEPSAALLPQWLSGYAFLFAGERDLEGARKLWAEVKPPPRAIVLDYDAGDLLAQAVAERVAVNSREAGLPLQVVGQGGARPSDADVLLVRLRVAGAHPALALRDCINTLGIELEAGVELNSNAESLYVAENEQLRKYFLIPLAHLPQMHGLSARVKNWMPTRLGEWRLADVWIDQEAEKKEGTGGAPALQERR